MTNKKVYLVKDPLASGLDVEFVKSHLSRIPNIAIVECGLNIKPQECMAMVYVPNTQNLDDGYLGVNKTVFKLIEKFLKNQDISQVYVYTSKESSDHPRDVEKETPMCVYLEDLDCNNPDSFEDYGELFMSDPEEKSMLLGYVANAICEDVQSWTEKPRHRMPEPGFQLPPMPTAEDRLFKRCTAASDDGDMKGYVSGPTTFIIHNPTKRRPLLRRRK